MFQQLLLQLWKHPDKSTFMVHILHRFKLLMINISIFFFFFFFLGNFTWIVFRPIFFCYEKQGMNFRFFKRLYYLLTNFGVKFIFFSSKSFIWRKVYRYCMLTVIVTLECLPLSKFYWTSFTGSSFVSPQITSELYLLFFSWNHVFERFTKQWTLI